MADVGLGHHLSMMFQTYRSNKRFATRTPSLGRHVHLARILRCLSGCFNRTLVIAFYVAVCIHNFIRYVYISEVPLNFRNEKPLARLKLFSAAKLKGPARFSSRLFVGRKPRLMGLLSRRKRKSEL